jgi:hypothetical protein
MKTARNLYSIFWIALTLMASPALAQTEAESATLVIESQSGSQSQTLKVGDRINYQPVGGQMQRKGRLEAVGDSSLTIAGKAIAFKDLQAIVHIKGKKKPAGLGLLVGSLIAEPIGLLFFSVALLFLLDNPSAAQRVIIGILAVLTIFIFPLLIVLGLILLATGSKRYDLRSRWRLRKG